MSGNTKYVAHSYILVEVGDMPVNMFIVEYICVYIVSKVWT